MSICNPIVIHLQYAVGYGDDEDDDDDDDDICK